MFLVKLLPIWPFLGFKKHLKTGFFILEVSMTNNNTIINCFVKHFKVFFMKNRSKREGIRKRSYHRTIIQLLVSRNSNSPSLISVGWYSFKIVGMYLVDDKGTRILGWPTSPMSATISMLWNNTLFCFYWGLPIKSWGSKVSTYATVSFKRSYKISHIQGE